MADPALVAKELRDKLGGLLRICVLGGGAELHGTESDELMKAAGRELARELGSEAWFVTDGTAGAQAAFAEHCGDGSRVWNLLPAGQVSGICAGVDVHAGADLPQRRAVFGRLGDLYLAVGGGPEVAEHARTALERGAAVIPLGRTGGASAGEFGFPPAALERPAFATEEQWALLSRAEGSADEAAAALAAVVRAFLATRPAAKQQSVWEILDELISIDRGTLAKMLGAILLILMLISVGFIYHEVASGRPEMALLHGGFLFLVFGLVGSVAWVLAEASRLEADGGRPPEEAAAQKKAD